ncbi:uncharacterized protein LOC115665714 isoform X1 [Syzygium oleosum]|uniref:uncharacterized protein LOC115665714 isoform X1 n=1 Tax=Syzygium oleosum TaxID=219896 RepID=UPI0024B99770|nr:uncharacterized protein LOC115665714 isoform X1 [Syzygium oleosum]
MEIWSSSASFFQSVRSRELTGFRVRKRPYVADSTAVVSEVGAVAVEHHGDETPPLALSFCQTSKCSYVLAVSDEDGYVSLFDTRPKSSASSTSCRENAGKARIGDWVAHQNAIFDICWIKEDTKILTASGDQTIRLWDVENRKSSGVLMGHAGSVKSLCSHPTNSDLLVSGSRDGSFAIWDLRCKCNTRNRQGEFCISPTYMVKGAHPSPRNKWVRRGKAASTSTTAVLYLKDEVSVATAGAVDSTVKFWDMRNLKAQITQTCPDTKSASEQVRRLHGVSSLSQDSNGVFLSASCMDNRIYLYNILQLEKGPVASFSGCRIESFYVKSKISPDASNLLSGSSDGTGYIWQMNKPDAAPITLNSHDGEVSAVAWSPHEAGKLATCSDDYTVRVWNIKNKCCSTTRSPTAIRKRVMAIPTGECKRLLMTEDTEHVTKDPIPSSSEEESQQINFRSSITLPKISTPEAPKKNFASNSYYLENCEKTPEATLKSPSSVLNPPSSVKRTIRDYFVAPS